MKTCKYVWLFSLLIGMLASLPACSDDDDGKKLPVNEQSLVGTWELRHTEGWNQYKDKRETFSEDDDTYRIEFKRNGTAQTWTYEGRWIPDDFVITDWYIEDEVLYTHDSEGDDEVVTIVLLTESKLIVESYSSDRMQYYKETYERID